MTKFSVFLVLSLAFLHNSLVVDSQGNAANAPGPTTGQNANEKPKMKLLRPGGDFIEQLKEKLAELEGKWKQVSSLVDDIDAIRNDVAVLNETVENIGILAYEADEKNKQQDIDIAASQTKKEDIVAFSAIMKRTTDLVPGQTVIFENVLTNYGNAYSGVCGTFKAPVHGLYFFTVFFITGAYPSPTTNLDIMVNNIRQCVAYGDRDHRHATGTCAVIVELNVGDIVHVEHEDPHNDLGEIWGSGPYSGFTGYLYTVL